MISSCTAYSARPGTQLTTVHPMSFTAPIPCACCWSCHRPCPHFFFASLKLKHGGSAASGCLDEPPHALDSISHHRLCTRKCVGKRG